MRGATRPPYPLHYYIERQPLTPPLVYRKTTPYPSIIIQGDNTSLRQRRLTIIQFDCKFKEIKLYLHINGRRLLYIL